jgi:hypothetical protein
MEYPKFYHGNGSGWLVPYENADEIEIEYYIQYVYLNKSVWSEAEIIKQTKFMNIIIENNFDVSCLKNRPEV